MEKILVLAVIAIVAVIAFFIGKRTKREGEEYLRLITAGLVLIGIVLFVRNPPHSSEILSWSNLLSNSGIVFALIVMFMVFKEGIWIFIYGAIIGGTISFCMLMYLESQNEKTEKVQEIVDFKTDLYSDVLLSSICTEYRKVGETDNYAFVLSISDKDTFGRYQAKYTGKIEDYYWDDMDNGQIDLLINRIKEIK